MPEREPAPPTHTPSGTEKQTSAEIVARVDLLRLALRSIPPPRSEEASEAVRILLHELLDDGDLGHDLWRSWRRGGVWRGSL